LETASSLSSKSTKSKKWWQDNNSIVEV
jgi:hypothetical protein